MMPTVDELKVDFLRCDHPQAPVFRLDGTASVPSLGPASIAIGAFDGVHRGHRELIAATCADARARGIRSAIVTFDPDPDVVLSQHPAKKLMSAPDRLDVLARTGVDAVIVVPFTRELASLDHEAFFALLGRILDIETVRVGSDFRLGRGGASDVSVISSWGADRGIEVFGHELLREDGETICSTRIRSQLDAGHVEEAAHLLGRAFMVRGEVESGRGEGAGMGFPTANVHVDARLQMPADGVYEGLTLVGDTVWPAAVNVGLPPTYADRAASAHLEANLIGFTGDLYGRSVSLAFTRWLRPSRTFDELDELIETVEGNISDITSNLGDKGVALV